MPGLKENTNRCEGIARDLICFAEAGAFICPDCGNFAYYDSETDSFKCAGFDKVRIVSEYPDGAELNEDFYDY